MQTDKIPSISIFHCKIQICENAYDLQTLNGNSPVTKTVTIVSPSCWSYRDHLSHERTGSTFNTGKHKHKTMLQNPATSTFCKRLDNWMLRHFKQRVRSLVRFWHQHVFFSIMHPPEKHLREAQSDSSSFISTLRYSFSTTSCIRL